MGGKFLPRIDRQSCGVTLDLLVKMVVGLLIGIVAGLFSFLLGQIVAWAGPPFVTDDPEPVEYRHWEF